MGTVTSLLVREGDPVEAGQLLLTIDDRDVVQKVKAAEAGNREAAQALDSARQNRELAEITSQRYQKMYDEKGYLPAGDGPVCHPEAGGGWNMNGCRKWETGRRPVLPRRRSSGLYPDNLPA